MGSVAKLPCSGWIFPEGLDALPVLPPNVFTNRHPAETNSTILLFDGVNTRFADQSYARLQISSLLNGCNPAIEWRSMP